MLLDLFNTYRADAQHIASVLLALAIWRWGGAPERWSIGLLVVLMLLPIYTFEWLKLGDNAFGPFAWVWVATDLIAAAGFILIAVYANRNYPLWVAGFQVVAVSAHAVKGLIDTVTPLAYLILAIGPSYCQILLIFAGFVRHVMRQRRFGHYRAWRSPLPGAA
jgi:hypothetical protein